MSVNEWPTVTTILVEVHEPLPTLIEGESVTVMTDDHAFGGFFAGILVEDDDE